ncbi:MAG TPA: LapA family protein [Gaiellaceae bacterium]
MSEPPATPSRSPGPAAAGRSRAATVKLVVIGLVALFAILFIVQNTKETKVDFVFGSAHVSVIWVIVLSIALGFALGTLLPQLRRRRRGRKG